MDAKLSQQLAGLCYEPLLQVFLYVQKYYDSLDQRRYVEILRSCSIPRWDNLPSGHQRYPLKGLNLWYMYWGQKHYSE